MVRDKSSAKTQRGDHYTTLHIDNYDPSYHRRCQQRADESETRCTYRAGARSVRGFPRKSSRAAGFCQAVREDGARRVEAYLVGTTNTNGPRPAVVQNTRRSTSSSLPRGRLMGGVDTKGKRNNNGDEACGVTARERHLTWEPYACSLRSMGYIQATYRDSEVQQPLLRRHYQPLCPRRKNREHDERPTMTCAPKRSDEDNYE